MRKYYLDNIRTFTIVIVVIYHVFMIFSQAIPGLGMPFSEYQLQDMVMYAVYPWMMILLFMVAGMSSRYYLETHTVKEYVKSRTDKLLVPSTLGVLCIGWVQGYFQLKISGAFETMKEIPALIVLVIMTLSGIGVLWFAQMLWLFSMILALVKRYEKGRFFALTKRMNTMILFFTVILLWASGQLFNMPIITVYRFGVYFYSFFFGYFVLAHDEVMVRISRWKPVFILSSVVLGVLYMHRYFGKDFTTMPAVGSALAVGYAWSTILAIFGCARAWLDRVNRFTDFWKRKSWGIYIFHYVCTVSTAYLLRTYTDIGAAFCYLITAACAFGGSIALEAMIKKTPFLRFCVLGMRGK